MDIKEIIGRVKSGESVYLNADCMKYLPHFPENFFDVAHIDPPYGILGHILSLGGRNKSQITWLKNGQDQGEWDTAPDSNFFESLFLSSQKQIIWGGNHLTNHLPPSRGWIVWDKMADGFSIANSELAYTNYDTAVKMFRRSHGLDKGFLDESYHIKHPTKKPKALYRWVAQKYFKPNQIILDTHVGSANSLVVYEELGFQYVAFEKDPDYYADSLKNIATHIASFKARSEEQIKLAPQISIFDKL